MHSSALYLAVSLLLSESTHCAIFSPVAWSSTVSVKPVKSYPLCSPIIFLPSLTADRANYLSPDRRTFIIHLPLSFIHDGKSDGGNRG
jgi:hypothetical protein